MESPRISYVKCTINSLIKDQPSSVYDSLLGIALTHKNLVVLENHCTIMRRDHKHMKGKVKIIAGGGAGNEPSEAYYVGRGMLTAAVVGEVFTSPSANEILLAIRELAFENSEGILLLVKNYIGDRLNFTVAMEQAIKENIPVKMFIIQDNVINYAPAKQGRHGLAGSILIYKIAGELSEQGKLLEEIIDTCEEVSHDLGTANVIFGACSGINCNILKKLLRNSDRVLLGLGIYGKGRTKSAKLTNLQDVVSLVLEEIITYFSSNSESFISNVVVMVNNLGATTKLEEAVIAKEVFTQLNRLGYRIAKLFVGTFMSSFAIQGFSVSILGLNSADIIKYLTAPTSAPGWPGYLAEVFESQGSDLPITVATIISDELLAGMEYPHSSCLDVHYIVLSDKATAAMKLITIFAAEALISCERQLNLIDSETGDGDIGTTFRKGGEALRKAVLNDEMTLRKPYKFLYEVSEICSKFMGGLSGILYCIFFKAAGQVFQKAETFTPELCCNAFKEAVKALKHYSNSELGERTLLDVLTPASEAFESALNNGRNLVDAVYLAAATSEFKSEETKSCFGSLIPGEPHRPFTYPDAGGHAATIWLRAVSEGLKLHYPAEC